MSDKKHYLFVTHVGTFGPYLKIIGQANKGIALNMQNQLNDVLPHLYMPKPDDVQRGLFCLAKRAHRFVRATVDSVSGNNCDRIIVNFVDYGHSQTVQLTEMRIGSFPPEIISLKPICTSYILLGICYDWQPEQVLEIIKDVQNKTLEFSVWFEICSFLFIRMMWKEFDFSDYLISHRQIGVPIADEKLQTSFSQQFTFQNRGNCNDSNSNGTKMQTKRDYPIRSVRPARPLHESTIALQAGGMLGVNRMTLRSLVQEVHNDNARIPYTGSQKELSMVSRVPTTSRRSVATFMSNSLMVNTVYDVICCYVENGPCLFCVQLSSTERDLLAMMSGLERTQLRNLTEKPALGMACIARFSEDKQVYRALITNIKPTMCHVAYIDYGNSEWVPFSDIYEIPTEFLQNKTFSIKFSLSGCKELDPIDDQIKQAFKQIALFKSLKLKVMPLEGPPLVQYCELNINGENVLDMLKEIAKKKNAYIRPEPITNDDLIVIRYIDSPKKFYVQKVTNISSFARFSDDLDNYCNLNKEHHNNIAIGSACAVQLSRNWYRAQVISEKKDNVLVRMVDYGYEQEVKRNDLFALPEKLMRIPQQAVQCCLKGFEDIVSVKDLATTQFEMLAEDQKRGRKQFNVKVVRVQPDDVYLVHLYYKELDVTKKLYKFGMPFDKFINLEKEVFNDASRENILNSTSLTAEENNRIETSNQTGDRDLSRYESADNRNLRYSSTEYKAQLYKPKPSRESNRNVNFSEDKAVESITRITEKSDVDVHQQRNGPTRMRGQYEMRRQDSRRGEGNIIASHNLSTASNSSDKEVYVPLDHEFPRSPIEIPSRYEAKVCWWISPYQFFTHLQSRTPLFEKLMKQLQSFYKSKPSMGKVPKLGSSVIARYKRDGILYRGRVTACNQPIKKYKVQFVDFGNEATVSIEDLWEVEERFADFPCMGYMCSFSDIVPNFEQKYISNILEKFINFDTKVICEYCDKENNLYFVNVIINGISLKDSLVKEGVISQVNSDVRLELLADQQIRANIVSIRDMLNFQIQVEGCDVTLLCSYEDIKFVKLNPEMNKKFKEFYEGKSCVLDVCHVTDDKILIVRPLLPLITNDIPKYICQYPILHETIQIRVVYVESPFRLFAHRIDEADKMSKLLEDMFEYYEQKGNLLEKYEVGSICAAKSADGNWYRARILSNSTAEKNKFDVFFIDYGNTETINNEPRSNLKRLLHKFCNISSALAIEINLPICAKKEGGDQNATVIMNELKSLTADYELTAKVMEMRANRIIADILSEGYSIIQVLKDKELVSGKDLKFIQNICDSEPLNVYEYIETVDLTSDIEECELEDNQKILAEKPEEDALTTVVVTAKSPKKHNSAMLSHIENPSKFYIHMENNLMDLRKFQENLQIVATSLPPLLTVTNNTLCIAQNTVDKQWYRTKIIDSELIAVLYIDYGTYDVITDSNLLREMTMFSDYMPACAIPCALPIKPLGSADWCEEVNKYIPYECSLEFEYITRGDKKNFVNLFVDGNNVADKLVADGHAKHLELIPSGEKCYISHINNLSEFYIQMERTANGLTIIETALDDIHKTAPLLDFKENKICAAFYSFDERWYRARLLSRNESGFEVFFVDYGNTATSPSIFEMPDEIANLPSMAKKCSIYMPDHILGWSQQAEEFFDSIIESNELIVELKEPGDPAIVELIVDGQNLLESLEPLCDRKPTTDLMNMSISTNLQCSLVEGDQCEVFVSHYNSPADFFLQMVSDVSKLEDLTSSLNEATMSSMECPVLGTTCAAIFREDNALYRAKLLKNQNSEYLVSFIDFGNTGYADDLRVLPDDLISIPDMCTHCRLENSELITSNPQWTERVSKALNSNEAIKIEIIDKTLKPWTVRVFVNGKNLSMHLESDRLFKEKVHISYATNPSTFFVQPIASMDQLEEISQLLNENRDAVALNSVALGSLCAAFFDEDETYYRAELIEKQENDRYKVFFIDYGNTALTSKILALPKAIEEIGPICRKCSLNTIPFSDKEFTSVCFTNYVNSHCEEVFEVEYLEDCNVRLFLNDVDVAEELINIVSTNTESNIPLRIQVHIGFAVNHTEFYVQRLECINQVEEITTALNEKSELLPLESIGKGILCAAFFSEDQRYYRARIIEVLEDCQCNVFFVDFGNSTVTANLKALPENLLNIPNLAEKFSLGDISYSGTKEIEEKFTSFMDAHFGEVFELEITAENCACLYIGEINVAEELQNAGSNVGNFKKCKILSANSPSRFFIQICDDSVLMDEITECLKHAIEWPAVEIKEGALCAAKFPEDGAYYRAQILSVLGQNKSNVLFIDFGNESQTEDVRELPEKFKTIERVAKHCALEMPNSPDIAGNLFNEFINSHVNETFLVEIMKTSTDPWIVRLFHNNLNLASDLLKQIRVETENVEYCQKLVNEIVKSKNIDSKVSEIFEIDSDSSQHVHTRDLINDIIDNAPMNGSSGVGSLNSSNCSEKKSNFSDEVSTNLLKNFKEMNQSTSAAETSSL